MGNFDFSSELILENDFVRISPLKVEHVERLLDISEEPNLWTYFLEKGNGLDNLTQYILSATNKRKLNKEYPLIVFDKIKGKHAGTTRFYEYSADLKTIKLGHTWYGKDFRGTGLNKHCKYLLLQFAFEMLNLERIGFGVHGENKVSLVALKSIGCEQEGVLRNFLPSLDGLTRTDLFLFSILKKEWFDVVKKDLNNKLTKN